MINTKKFFTDSLLRWNKKDNDRPMPWKGEKDPYKIWLSEIILQQTRVEQGWDYYNRFVAVFANITQLAKAPETKVFKLWEGLGYYSRCKNLLATAKIIATTYKGKFPNQYDDILALKGIGPYTAAAIASFAFNQPYAVVDGNVFRVLSRFFGIRQPVDSTAGKKLFTTLATALLNKKQPGTYNQALMDFGAVICKPKQALCTACPLKIRCVAYLKGIVNALPVKEKRIAKKNRWFYYLVVEHNRKVYVRKRGPKDIWENLYEFILQEATGPNAVNRINSLPVYKKLLGKNAFKIKAVSNEFRQQLTHQTIHGQFIHISVNKPLKAVGYTVVDLPQLKKLPFPKLITAYLNENREKAFER